MSSSIFMTLRKLKKMIYLENDFLNNSKNDLTHLNNSTGCEYITFFFAVKLKHTSMIISLFV